MNWHQSGRLRWLEADLPGAQAAFSTRLGGVSSGPFESLNLGILTGDDAGLVRQNRRLLAAALALDPASVVIARQVHGGEVAIHDGPQQPSPFAQPRAPIPEVDGHVLRRAGVAGLVFVADCLPVALAGSRGAALLHCGWRGLAAGIVATGVEAVGATAAAIGPGIGRCCYEVGEEVIDALSGLGDGIAEGPMLDLEEVARRLLRGAGVESIESAGICTSCEAELFFSHRRDGGRTGRQAGVVWMNGGA